VGSPVAITGAREIPAITMITVRICQSLISVLFLEKKRDLLFRKKSMDNNFITVPPFD
jgi:hypothetical protein